MVKVQFQLLKSEKKCKETCKEMQQFTEFKKLYNKDVKKCNKFIKLTKMSKLLTKDQFGIQI